VGFVRSCCVWSWNGVLCRIVAWLRERQITSQITCLAYFTQKNRNPPMDTTENGKGLICVLCGIVAWFIEIKGLCINGAIFCFGFHAKLLRLRLNRSVVRNCCVVTWTSNNITNHMFGPILLKMIVVDPWIPPKRVKFNLHVVYLGWFDLIITPKSLIFVLCGTVAWFI